MSRRPKTRVEIRLTATTMPMTAIRKKAAFEAADRFFLSMLMASSLPLSRLQGGGGDEERHHDDGDVVDDIARVDDAAADLLEMAVGAEERRDGLQLLGHEGQHLAQQEQREADAERDDQRDDLLARERRGHHAAGLVGAAHQQQADVARD